MWLICCLHIHGHDHLVFIWVKYAMLCMKKVLLNTKSEKSQLQQLARFSSQPRQLSQPWFVYSSIVRSRSQSSQSSRRLRVYIRALSETACSHNLYLFEVILRLIFSVTFHTEKTQHCTESPGHIVRYLCNLACRRRRSRCPGIRSRTHHASSSCGPSGIRL